MKWRKFVTNLSYAAESDWLSPEIIQTTFIFIFDFNSILGCDVRTFLSEDKPNGLFSFLYMLVFDKGIPTGLAEQWQLLALSAGPCKNSMNRSRSVIWVFNWPTSCSFIFNGFTSCSNSDTLCSWYDETVFSKNAFVNNDYHYQNCQILWNSMESVIYS